MAYNQNAIASLAQSTGPKYLGADVSALNGKLDFEPLWEYSVRGNAPKPVILNNSGQGYPFPTSYQVADRLVQLSVQGWYNVPVHLRLIDPPDMSAYAPVGGWPAKGAPAVPPYEANDNDVWADSSNTDWGLSATYPGTLNKNLEIDVYPSSSNTATFYLKLPARYAGDNWQIEVRKKNPYGTLIANKISSYSAMFTGWKRVYVERDHMFRRGNLLDPTASGGVFTPDTNTDPDTIYLYRWDQTTPKTDVTKYVQPGDTVVIFDTDSPYPSGAHETATVVSTDFVDVPINPANCFPPDCGQLSCQCVSVLAATLDKDLKNSYHASPLDFSSGKSAAVGVIHSADGQIYDTASNQINGPGSAFYDADMRDIKQPFDDAFVEFIAPRSGMGAVPYIDPATGFYDNTLSQRTTRSLFSNLWYGNSSQETNNYIHLLGVRGSDYGGVSGQIAGDTSQENKYSLVYTRTWETEFSSGSDAMKAIQTATDHELGHQFYVNACSLADDCTTQSAANHHDYRPWWSYSTTGCPGTNPNPCLMDPNGGNATDTINRFCVDDLLLGDPKAPCVGSTKDETTIRTVEDPLPLKAL
jgi:hypothetical protein